MFAKLHFNASAAGHNMSIAIAGLLSGDTLAQIHTKIEAAGINSSKLDQSKSYIISTVAPGWTSEGTSSVTLSAASSFISAPCTGSSKRKYVELDNSYSMRVGASLSGGPTSKVLSAGPAVNVTTSRSYFGTAGTTNNYNIRTDVEIELWVSASPNHIIIAANNLGFRHFTGGAGTQAATYCTGIFEHTISDAWMTEGSSFLPVVHMFSPTASNVSAGSDKFQAESTGVRNISSASIVNTSGATQMHHMFTKWGGSDANGITNYTFSGSCTAPVSDTQKVKTLMPFGFKRNSTNHPVRGGSVSDLCNVYLVSSKVFPSNTEIQVGSDRYMIFTNISGQVNSTLIPDFAVPKA